ncbi:MAG: hypothetical protein ACK5LX_10540 [Oscillospiraceae bacterium]
MKSKKRNGKMIAINTALAIALVAGSSVTAFAASSTDTTGSDTTATTYGYLTGQQKNSDRHAVFETAASLATDEEREAYLESQGIGGEYSTAQHLDMEELVTAGVIDQATADSIQAYASGKHDKIHARYDSMEGMTIDERVALYESAKSDSSAGDSVDELVSAGIITQEQADAINAYLGE